MKEEDFWHRLKVDLRLITNMENNVLLVGCGEIGSRHLQALVKINNIKINIIEPSLESRKIAIERISEITNKDQKLFWYNSINEVKNKMKLVIVATLAVNRVEQIISLLEKGHKKFLIEKMVCQSDEQYKLLLSKIKEYEAVGWVNVSRRYFPVYQNIKKMIEQTNTTHISIIIGNRGLGTVAVHYLDLFSWFTENIDIKLSGEYLLEKLFPNKRDDNLIEFRGTITAKIKNGSSLMITSIPDSDLPIIINIKNNSDFIIYDEINMNMITQNTKSIKSDFKFEHISSTTTKIVLDILKNENCLLPKVEELYNIHSELFKIFNTHIKEKTGIAKKVCPIT